MNTKKSHFLHGVNLGGWLVLEKWMTPSLFAGTEAVDEYTFMQTEGALKKLRDHQKSFITEKDFRWMAKNGVNAVRIPVGYWLFEGDDPYRSCVGRLDWAFRMCEKYQLQVLVCLHGAPGSQNGHDHSGRVGDARWYRDEAYREQTVVVLKRIVERYRDSDAFWGVELLNEPKIGLFQRKLRRFYNNAYRRLTEVAPKGAHIVISDAFTPRLLSGALWPFKRYPVVLDHHWYHFFLPKILRGWLPFGVYYWYLRRIKAGMLRRLTRTQPVIIGEWNGIIAGEKLGNYPQVKHDDIVRKHIHTQLVAYNGALGWFYWSYKTEARGVFHFRSMVEDGFFDTE